MDPGEQDAAEREGDGGGEDVDEGDDGGGDGGHGWGCGFVSVVGVRLVSSVVGTEPGTGAGGSRSWFWGNWSLGRGNEGEIVGRGEREGVFILGMNKGLALRLGTSEILSFEERDE